MGDPELPGDGHVMRARVNEVYFAHQGEGPRLGVPSVFVRLHGCPVQCEWCDTPFTWDGSESGEATSVRALADRVIALARETCAEAVVVTGGEPLISKGLVPLLKRLTEAGLACEVETAAILPPPVGLDALSGVTVNLSPKLPSALPKILPDPALLRAWLLSRIPTTLKLVVADELDWRTMEALLRSLDLGPELARKVYLMPCATTRDGLAQAQAWLLGRAKGSPYRVTTRMHVAAYGDERGR